MDTIVGLPWLGGSPSVWIAGESGAVRAVRRYLTQERQIERRRLYASGYWQIGLTEDRHQLEKRKDKRIKRRSDAALLELAAAAAGAGVVAAGIERRDGCLLYTSPSPRDLSTSRMPSSA